MKRLRCTVSTFHIIVQERFELPEYVSNVILILYSLLKLSITFCNHWILLAHGVFLRCEHSWVKFTEQSHFFKQILIIRIHYPQICRDVSEIIRRYFDPLNTFLKDMRSGRRKHYLPSKTSRWRNFGLLADIGKQFIFITAILIPLKMYSWTAKKS